MALGFNVYNFKTFWILVCKVRKGKTQTIQFSGLHSRQNGACTMTTTTCSNNINATIWVRSTLLRQWWTFSHNGMFHAPTALNLLTVLYYTETKQSLACKKKKNTLYELIPWLRLKLRWASSKSQMKGEQNVLQLLTLHNIFLKRDLIHAWLRLHVYWKPLCKSCPYK